MNISVVDILKRPEYTSLTSAKPHTSLNKPQHPLSNPHPIPVQSNQIVDLTEEEDQEEEEVGKLDVTTTTTPRNPPSPPQASSAPSLPPLSLPPPVAGSWECESCLLRNAPTDEKCAACTTLRPCAKQEGGVKGVGTAEKTPQLKPLSQFAPPAGSWSCDGCFVQNTPSQETCVACQASRPGERGKGGKGESSAVSAGGLLGSGVQGGFQLGKGTKLVMPTGLTNQLPLSGGFKLPSSSPSIQIPPGVVKLATTTDQSGVRKAEDAGPLRPLPQFAAPSGGWSCDTCLVTNQEADAACVACGTAQNKITTTGKSAAPVSATPLAISTTGGLKLGAGIQFGQGGLNIERGGPQGASGGLRIGGLLFGTGGGVKFGATPCPPKASGGLKIGGALFGAGGGLKFGATPWPPKASGGKETIKTSGGETVTSSSSSSSSLTLNVRPPGSWECPTCLISNKPDCTTCAACGGAQPDSRTTTSTPQSGVTSATCSDTTTQSVIMSTSQSGTLSQSQAGTTSILHSNRSNSGMKLLPIGVQGGLQLGSGSLGSGGLLKLGQKEEEGGSRGVGGEREEEGGRGGGKGEEIALRGSTVAVSASGSVTQFAGMWKREDCGCMCVCTCMHTSACVHLRYKLPPCLLSCRFLRALLHIWNHLLILSTYYLLYCSDTQVFIWSAPVNISSW